MSNLFAASSVQTQQNKANTQQSATVKPPFNPPPILYDSIDTGVATYASLDNGPMDYSCLVRPGNAEAGASGAATLGSGDDVLYHRMGHDVRRSTIDNSSNKFTPPPSSKFRPPVPTRNGTKQDGFYSMFEGAPEDSDLQYEDPTFLNEHDSAKQNGMFESTGYYVPTEVSKWIDFVVNNKTL